MSKPSITDWDNYKNYFIKELLSFTIPEEIQTNQIKALTSKLNRLYDEILMDYINSKTQYENTDDLIDEIVKRNQSGSNMEDRKKNGYNAAAEFVTSKGDTINLFDMRREYRARFNFCKMIVDAIESKKSSLITDAGIIKIEASLIGG